VDAALSETGSLLKAMDLESDGVISMMEWLVFWQKGVALTEKTLLRMEEASKNPKLRLLRLYNTVDKARTKQVPNQHLIAACKDGFAKQVSHHKLLARLARLLELYPIVSQERWIWAWDNLVLTDAELDEAVGTLCAANERFG
jgi:hypothetical protein